MGIALRRSDAQRRLRTHASTPPISPRSRARAAAARGSVLTADLTRGLGSPGRLDSLDGDLLGPLRHGPSRSETPPMGRPRPYRGLSRAYLPGRVLRALAGRVLPAEEFEAHFRQAGSVFEGHVERSVPGVEWSHREPGPGSLGGSRIGARCAHHRRRMAHDRGDERRRTAQGAGRRGAQARGARETRRPDGGGRLERHADLRPYRRGHAGADSRGLGSRRLARRRVRRPRRDRAPRGHPGGRRGRRARASCSRTP